jgi:peptidylprolyl isomerase
MNVLLVTGPRHASASRAWLRGGSEFRSRALSSEAPCCCKAAAGGSAAQCGAADDFLIGGSSTRRGLVGVALGASALGLAAFDAVAAGLPPEEKPKLCDASCETELENVG